MAQRVEKSPPIQNTSPATAAAKACLAAQEAFGTDSVSLTPVNQTIIDVNWYVLT